MKNRLHQESRPGHRVSQREDRDFMRWAKSKRLWSAWVPMKLRTIKRR